MSYSTTSKIKCCFLPKPQPACDISTLHQHLDLIGTNTVKPPQKTSFGREKQTSDKYKADAHNTLGPSKAVKTMQKVRLCVNI